MIVRSLALAALAVLGLSSAARAETHLDLIEFQGINNLPVMAAQSQGFFARHGLSVTAKITGGSDELRGGLAEGRYQLAIAAVDNAVAMAEVAKVDIAIVSGGDNSFNHLIVQPDIASLADLRGKTVIVDAVATAYAFQLYEILKRNGLNPGDYVVTPVGSTNRRAKAMIGSQEDKATMLNPPFTTAAEQAGLKDMGSVAKILGPYQASGLFALRSWAAANPATMVDFLQAYIEGLRWSLDPANKDAVTRLLAEGLELSPDLAAVTYAIAVDPVEGLAKDAKFDMEGFRNVLKLRAEWTGKPPGPPEKYLDLSYYEKALAGL